MSESPKIEVATHEHPDLVAIEDHIAELVAQALYAHILRKGLLKKGTDEIDSNPILAVS